MHFKDRIAVTSRDVTPEGYLRVGARISRSGIQEYRRGELGLDGDPRAIFRVFRPEAEVFSDESLASFALKPVTDNHPAELVTAASFSKLAVGFTGESIARDGDYVRTTMLLTSPAAIEKVRAGKSELSNGYTCDLEYGEGATPNGETFDAVQKTIRGNHIAIVDAGRCGSECRIDDRGCGDGCECASCNKTRKEPSEMPDNPKTRLVDNVPVTTLDEAFEVIERKDKLIADVKQATVALHDKYLAQATEFAKERDALQDEIRKLKAQVSDAAVDKKAQERLQLMIKAADYLGPDYDCDGRSNVQIAKDALVATFGDASVAGRKDDECLAMFSMLDMVPKGGVSLASALLPANRGDGGGNGRDVYAKNLADAWRRQEQPARAANA